MPHNGFASLHQRCRRELTAASRDRVRMRQRSPSGRGMPTSLRFAHSVRGARSAVRICCRPGSPVFSRPSSRFQGDRMPRGSPGGFVCTVSGPSAPATGADRLPAAGQICRSRACLGSRKMSANAAARTAIRTSPGPGCGSGRSTISRTSRSANWLERDRLHRRSDFDREVWCARREYSARCPR